MQTLWDYRFFCEKGTTHFTSQFFSIWSLKSRPQIDFDNRLLFTLLLFRRDTAKASKFFQKTSRELLFLDRMDYCALAGINDLRNTFDMPLTVSEIKFPARPASFTRNRIISSKIISSKNWNMVFSSFLTNDFKNETTWLMCTRGRKQQLKNHFFWTKTRATHDYEKLSVCVRTLRS